MTDDDDLHAEVARLLDHAAIAAAEAALAAAEARTEAAKQAAVIAEAAVHRARGVLPALVERAAAGEVIETSAVIDAHRVVADAEATATFTGAVARRLEGSVVAARTALADARHEAWGPVLRVAQDYQIRAGRLADRAKLLGQTGTNTFPAEAERRQQAKRDALAAAQAEFDKGTALLEIAARGGLRIPRHSGYAIPSAPTSERFARLYWNRPLSEEETQSAA